MELMEVLLGVRSAALSKNIYDFESIERYYGPTLDVFVHASVDSFRSRQRRLLRPYHIKKMTKRYGDVCMFCNASNPPRNTTIQPIIHERRKLAKSFSKSGNTTKSLDKFWNIWYEHNLKNLKDIII